MLTLREQVRPCRCLGIQGLTGTVVVFRLLQCQTSSTGIVFIAH